MKIYKLPIPEEMQPRSQKFNYPRHNTDYGVEQDFHEFLNSGGSFFTSNPNEADWHYLPIYWTRWHLNHNYGKDGNRELAVACSNAILNDNKTFTICQYDDGPLVDLGQSQIFLASRKSAAEGHDIPLLSSPHRPPWFKQNKRHLASFMGRLKTHPLRQEMADALNSNDQILIFDGNVGSRKFVKTVLRSHAVLAPRGYGGSSFRFFEALQLGVCPILLGDIDTRPFKTQIPWDQYSFFVDNAEELISLLASTTTDKLDEMGAAGRQFYSEHLAYQKWCTYLLKSLAELQH